MKKQQILAFSFVALLALSIGGLTIASAHGPGFIKGDFEPGEKHQIMLEQKADILGLSADELQAKHDEGLKFMEIAEEQGITLEQMQAKHMADLGQALADGKITQADYDKKLEWMSDKQAKFESGEWNPEECSKGFGGHKGFGKGFRTFDKEGA